ncbi:MAG: PAS domain S-box protein [Proteobacteria bacterium]|nr:PAS domain S-box protein [Pseudomonadota bacterium]
MSFRFKLGIAFCSVLILTITVALTSWWGMETALQRQKTIFSFSIDVDRLLNTLSHHEHTFNSSQDMAHAIAATDTLKQLTTTIEGVRQQPRQEQEQRVVKILDDLGQYRTDFTRFSGQMIGMETMKSRMIQESDRLLSHTRNLAEEGSSIATDILQQISRMLQAEKDYMLFSTTTAAHTVIETVTVIQNLTKQVMSRAEGDAERLKAFRISKVAAIYQVIFADYLKGRQNLQEMINHMHSMQEALAGELRNFVDLEQTEAQNQVRSLKTLTIAVSMSAVFLAIITTIVVATWITRPLEQLKNSATAILNGDLTTTVSIQSHDEIGQLGIIFNEMTSQLRKSFDDIHEYREHLEELVAKRTLELQKEVAERRAAEHAIRAGEERLRTIIDQSPMGIILWDTSFRVMQWNNAAGKIFGYSDTEALGMTGERLVPEGMEPHIKLIWGELISSKDGIRSHNDNICKDGHLIQCDWFNTPISDASGILIGALSLVENVTERLRIEKELLKIQKLESTGILAGGLAHDFNNILTAILGNINLSLLDQTLSQGTRKLLASAENASLRAKDLTQQLLTFAKGGEPIKESTSLSEVIEDSATFVLHGGNVSCACRLPENLWHALVDRGQISQVIQNIVLNSRHAMPNGGTVEIACSNVLPAEDAFALLDPKSKYVKIRIKDTGIGIPATLLDKIFDPYFTTKQEGSGLGLAITLSIINKHKGHILVNSETGKGTEFTIYLPAADSPPGQKAEDPQMATQDRHLQVLVMDDDETVQMVLQAMLTILGHQVFLTSNGSDAISLYRQRFHSPKPLDLVIIDLTVPGGLGGKETMTELQKIDKRVRAIVSSGYSNDPVMASYQQYGFAAAVTKPFILGELTKAIETSLACTVI